MSLDRALLYAKTNRASLAAKDLWLISDWVDSSGGAILDMYRANVIRDLLQLEGVQKEVKKLIESGQIPLELEGIFGEMIHVIMGISTRVSNLDSRVDGHDRRFEEVESESKKIKQDLSSLKENLSSRLRGYEEFAAKYQPLVKKLADRIEELETGNQNIQSQILTVRKQQVENSLKNHDVRMVTKILYDTPILNYPDLLKKALESFTFNEVLALSGPHSQDSINNDTELCFTGSMSIGTQGEV